MTSRVSVDEDVSTREERVDIEAARTKTMIREMITGERSASIVGITLSKSTLPVSGL